MTQKIRTTGFVLGLLSGSLCLALSARLPAAPTAPVKPVVAVPPNQMPDLLSGKLFPNTVKRSALTGAYHLLSLVDAQGKPAVCATQGAMLTLGGETFLVAYLLPPPVAPAVGTTPAASSPPPGDVDAQLTLINMRDVQAMAGFREVPPPSEIAAPPAPPAGPAPTPGTATP